MKNINWDKIKADAILVSNPKNIRHFTGLNASFGFLLLSRGKTTLFVDGRYFEVANETFKEGNVTLLNGIESLVPELNRFKTIAIESDYVTLDWFEKFRKMHNNIISINGQTLRLIKDEEDLAHLNKAVAITKQVMELAAAELQPGKTEKDIELFILNKLYELGSEEVDYWPIIISGPNSSKPHGKATNRILQPGDPVMFDFAAVINGYTADITRNYFVPGIEPDPEIIKITDIVRRSQLAGIEAVKPGVAAAEIDAICRKIIVDEGYGPYFTHSTGHGLGRDVHELPVVSPKSTDILEIGNVITIEPAIYIPGKGGVRIEDDILVTKEGYKVL